MAEKNNIKTMSKKGKEVTKELEKLTGIDLTSEEEKVTDTNVSTESKEESKLQDIKDVDLGEDNAMKPLLFKCPNDMYLSIRKDSGEMIIDESCCTILSVMVKNTGEINTNFSGSHNPDLVKVLSKAMKKYLRELKKKLKADYKVAREELELKSEDIPEDMKFDATKEVETERPWNLENFKTVEENETKKAVKKPSDKKTTAKNQTSKKSPTKKSTTAGKKTSTPKSSKTTQKKTPAKADNK